MYTPLDIEKQKSQKTLIFSVVGLSAITTNDTIYVFGGKTDEQTYNTNVWYISSKDIPLNSSPTLIESRQNNLALGSGVIANQSIIAVCSNATTAVASINTNLTRSGNTTARISTLSICSFDLNAATVNSTWTIRTSDSSTRPAIRDKYAIAAAPDQSQIFVFGGQKLLDQQQANQTESSVVALQSRENGNFWKYNVQSTQWSRLPSPFTDQSSRCGHTATMLRDGRIVIIGGYNCLLSSDKTDSTRSSVDLVPMNTMLVFDTKSTTWNNIPQVQGIIPAPRIFHSAALMNDNNDIFICGGQNEMLSPFQVYLGSQQNRFDELSAILDTNSWTWRIPKQSPSNQPYPQSFAVLSRVNGTKLIYGYGINYHSVHDQFRVFDTLTESWEATALTEKSSNTEYSSASPSSVIIWIILGCIGFIIVSSYGAAIWTFGFRRFHAKVKNVLAIIKREAWKPRVGEPGWAESLRLLLKLLFLLLFLYLIFTLTSQVINSPVIDQLSFEVSPERTVDVPDIQFCFDNNAKDSGNKEPFIQCATDFGIQCSQFITPMQYQTGTGHMDAAKTRCLLFNAPSSFRLGPTSERIHSNGSFLKFDYYYKVNGRIPLMNDISADSNQLQVTVYNKLNTLERRDPNYDINIHTDKDEMSIFDWSNTAEEDERYKYANARDNTIRNSYHLNFGFTSTINFELIKRVTLNAGVWNYAGIASSVSTRHEIETAETPEYFSTVYDPSSGAPQPLGSLHVIPLTTQTKVLREQKAFAFINAMGIFGGLFGLLFSLQSCLFGYRPRSPWGYMHRWSFGHFRSSLLRGLQVNFFPNNSPIALGSASPTLPFRNQEQLHRYRMSPIEVKPSTLSSRMNPIMEANHVHPLTIQPKLSIQTKNLQNSTPSYLLPTSPTLSVPVGHHEEEKEIRMALIEDRIHMLERLFQAYYIDDEIFRSLAHALQNDASSSSSSTAASIHSAEAIKKPKE